MTSKDTESLTESNKPDLVNHDPNYKWRMLGGLGVIFLTLSGLAVTVIFSQALTAPHIVGLFGMEFAIVLIVVLLVLRYPSTNQNSFSMDNPWVSVPFSTFAGLLAALLFNWIAGK